MLEVILKYRNIYPADREEIEKAKSWKEINKILERYDLSIPVLEIIKKAYKEQK
jgi:hypothetical protein